MDTLTVDIIRAPLLTDEGVIRIRHDRGKVLLYLNEKHAELSTIDAHGVGFAIIKSSNDLEKDEIYDLKINGESIKLDKKHAIRVAAGLLRKADQADDYQKRGILS